MFRLRVFSLISKNQRRLYSIGPKIAMSPNLELFPLTALTGRLKTTEITYYSQIHFGPMQKLFSSIVGYFSGLKCLGVDQANNSYYTVSGERWVVFKDEDEISIPVEWIHWLSWKRMEAPTPKETIEQQETRKVILPSPERSGISIIPFFGYCNAMCLSRDGMSLRLDGILDWDGETSILFSVEKRLIQDGDIYISAETRIPFHIVDFFEQLIEGLASKTNPLISDKFEEEAGAPQGSRSFEDTEDVNLTYDFVYLNEPSFSTYISSKYHSQPISLTHFVSSYISNYFSNIFRFQLSRANRFGDPKGCAPRKFNSQGG